MDPSKPVKRVQIKDPDQISRSGSISSIQSQQSLNLKKEKRRSTMLSPEQDKQISKILHTLHEEHDHERPDRHRRQSGRYFLGHVKSLLKSKVHPHHDPYARDRRHTMFHKDDESLSSGTTHTTDSESEISNRPSWLNEQDDKKTLRKKFVNIVKRVKDTIGLTEFMRELRVKQEEYALQVEDFLKRKRSHKYAVEHPYVALRKRIEAMSKTGQEEYIIQYRPFTINPKMLVTEIPTFATEFGSRYKWWWWRIKFDFSKICKCLKYSCRKYKNRKASKINWRKRQRWLRRRGGVSNADPKSIIEVLNDDFGADEAEAVYEAHVELRERLRDLYITSRAKFHWALAFNKTIVKRRRFRSIIDTIRYLLRQQDARAFKLESLLIKKIIRRCSLTNLATSTENRIQECPMKEKQNIFIDQILDNVSNLSSEDSSDSDSEDDDMSVHSAFHNLDHQHGDTAFANNCSSSEDSFSSVFRRVVGKPEKCNHEIFLDIAIRLKRHLGLPYDKMLHELRSLRHERSFKEWQVIRRFDKPPVEHFITVRVVKEDQSTYLVGLRVIVLPSYGHFVRKRLPIPRPNFVYTDERSLSKIPGPTRDRKIFQLAMDNMKTRLGGLSAERLNQPSVRISLLDNLNSNLYKFIDSDKTCVVIIEDPGSSNHRKNKYRWLTPTLKRQRGTDNIPPLHDYTFDIEEVTVLGLMHREKKTEKIIKMWNEPSDIIYHAPSLPTVQSLRRVPPPAPSSNKGIYTAIPPSSQPPRPPIIDENYMRNRFNVNSPRRLEAPLNVRHLTNENWGKELDDEDDTKIVVLHDLGGKPMKQQSVEDLQHNTHFQIPKIVVKELKFDAITSVGSSVKKLSDGKSMQPVYSQGMERIKVLSRDDQLQVISSIDKFASGYSNLRNENTQYWYYTDEKTLIIEKNSDEQIVEALSKDESMGTLMPRNRKAELKLSRISGNTALRSSKSMKSSTKKKRSRNPSKRSQKN